MPVYVYGCDEDKGHERVEVAHGMGESVTMFCQVCGAGMHRVPQAFRWGRSAWDVLAEKMDKKYTAWREMRRKGLRRG